MNSQFLIDSFQKLPPIAKQEFIDYLAFLLQKYHVPNQFSVYEEEILTDSEKEFLDQRYNQMKSSPEDNILWPVLKDQIFTENNWK